MPNHVQNVLRVHGNGAEAIIGKYFRIPDGDQESDDKTFDFNALIPMPPICHEVVENGMGERILPLLLHGDGAYTAWEACKRFDRNNVLGEWKGLFGFKKGEIEERLEAFHPGCIEQARKMAKCFAETGHKSWYSWSVANWGTKWNSYGATMTGSGDRIELRFQTAWSVPEPVLQELVKQCPALAFEYWAFDEGYNFFAVGHSDKGTMAIDVHDHADPVKDLKAREVYLICYERDPPRDDEEDAA